MTFGNKLVDCETKFKGTTFCYKKTSEARSTKYCVTPFMVAGIITECPNMKAADGCNDCMMNGTASVQCLCSKDECNKNEKNEKNEAIKTSYSKIVALVPIITIIKVFVLGIF